MAIHVSGRNEHHVMEAVSGKSGIAKRLGRRPGQRPKSVRLAPKVLALVGRGRSYRLIGRELGLSKNTVADIVKREPAVCAGLRSLAERDQTRQEQTLSPPSSWAELDRSRLSARRVAEACERFPRREWT